MSINLTTFRDDIVTRLSGNTDAGTAVYSSKITPSHVDDLPDVVVLSPTVFAQAADHVQDDNITFLADVTFQLVLEVAHSETYATDLDTLANQVKDVLFTDPLWQAQFEAINGYTERIELRRDAETAVATLLLEIEVRIVDTWEP